jgi:asparagine synthase (glutamine-hydrolysing)
MCGIGGFSGDFPDDLLDRFVERLRHRGPDDRGSFLDRAAGIGLAHTRLSILDLAAWPPAEATRPPAA